MQIFLSTISTAFSLTNIPTPYCQICYAMGLPFNTSSDIGARIAHVVSGNQMLPYRPPHVRLCNSVATSIFLTSDPDTATTFPYADLPDTLRLRVMHFAGLPRYHCPIGPSIDRIYKLERGSCSEWFPTPRDPLLSKHCNTVAPLAHLRQSMSVARTLQLVSKQMDDDAISILYGENIFFLRVCKRDLRSLEQMRPKALAMLRRLHIQIYPTAHEDRISCITILYQMCQLLSLALVAGTLELKVSMNSDNGDSFGITEKEVPVIFSGLRLLPPLRSLRIHTTGSLDILKSLTGLSYIRSFGLASNRKRTPYFAFGQLPLEVQSIILANSDIVSNAEDGIDGFANLEKGLRREKLLPYDRCCGRCSDEKTECWCTFSGFQDIRRRPIGYYDPHRDRATYSSTCVCHPSLSGLYRVCLTEESVADEAKRVFYAKNHFNFGNKRGLDLKTLHAKFEALNPAVLRRLRHVQFTIDRSRSDELWNAEESAHWTEIVQRLKSNHHDKIEIAVALFFGIHGSPANDLPYKIISRHDTQSILVKIRKEFPEKHVKVFVRFETGERAWDRLLRDFEME